MTEEPPDWPPYWPKPADDFENQETLAEQLPTLTIFPEAVSKTLAHSQLAFGLGTGLAACNSFVVWHTIRPQYVPNLFMLELWRQFRSNLWIPKTFLGIALTYSACEATLYQLHGQDNEANIVLSSVATGYVHQFRHGLRRVVYGGFAGLMIGGAVALSIGGAQIWKQWKTNYDLIKHRFKHSTKFQTRNMSAIN